MCTVPAAPTRILIADDAPTVCEALRWLLEAEHDLAVVGEASNGLEALEQAQLLHPHVIILDLVMPELDGLAVMRTLKLQPRPPIVIVLTVHSAPDMQAQVRAAGGDGFVEKSDGWATLIACVRRALAHNAATRDRHGPAGD